MDDVAGSLEAWLADRGEPTVVRVVGRAAGGLSQETWFLRLDGEGPVTDAVLRLPTPASGGRAIATQAAGLTAVAGTSVPAPQLLWWADADAGDGLDGRPFLVMSRAHGEVPVGWHVLPEPRRTALARRAVEVLADLHTIPVADSPFAGARRHPLMTLDGLIRALDRLAPVPLPIRAACGWLERHRPVEPGEDVLVHGDFRMGNLVVDDRQVRAVLDWELAAPGRREIDLAWCFLPVFEDPGVDREPLVRHYERRSGVVVDRRVLAWHRVAALVRLAYYSLSGTRAFDGGHSRDLRLAALRLRVPTTLRRLAEAMQDPTFMPDRGTGSSASALG